MACSLRLGALLALVAIALPACKEKKTEPAFQPLGDAGQLARPASDGGRLRMTIDPSNAESLYLGSQEEFLAGEFEQAAEHLRQALRLSPDPKTWHALGDALLAQARFTDAASAYRAAVGMAPTKRISWMRLGRALINSGRPSEAVEAYRKAQELKPDDATAFREEAEALIAAGQPLDAVGRLQKASDLDPAGKAADLKLSGQLFADQGAYAKAAEALAGSAQLHPDAAIYGELGDALVRADDLDGARKAFQEAGRLDPKDPFPQELIAEIELRLGNAEKAKAAFAASLAVKARPSPHLGLGRIALLAGDEAEAHRELERALDAATGEEASEARELAGFALQLEDWAVAEKLLAMLAGEEEAGKDPGIWIELAVARRGLGQPQGVAEACAKAASLAPKDARQPCPPPAKAPAGQSTAGK